MRGDFDLIKNFDQLILSVIFFLIAAAIFLNTGVERCHGITPDHRPE